MFKVNTTNDFNPQKISRNIKKGIKPALTASILLVQNQGKRNAPFLTGNLRRSITHRVKKFSADAYTNLVYAAIHEYGGKAGRGRRTRIGAYKGRGYMRPALKSSIKEIVSIFKKHINRSINGN